jgi:adenosylcobinamide-GDP ribazoletransferase
MTPTPAWLRDIARDLKIAVQFCTRLPLGPAIDVTGADVARAAWAIPAAGVFVGVIGALAYALAHAFGLPPLPAAALTLAVTMMVTGGLHEDGLADTADGFGGTTREQKLAIMRDSRIGTFGTCALILSILARAGAIASLAAPALVMPALIAAHAAGRASMPIIMRLIPPARADGLSAEAGRVPQRSAGIAGLIGMVALAVAFGLAASFTAVLILLLVVGGATRLCVRPIGGQSGDVLGALEQIGEITILFFAAARH